MKKLVSVRLKSHAAGPHPDPELVAAFAENSLPQEDRVDLLEHFAACNDCRDILYLAVPDTAEAQPVVAASRRQPRFAWRWATLAASVVIIGSVIVSNRHMFTQHPHAELAPQSRDAAFYDAPASTPEPQARSKSDSDTAVPPAREARLKARPETKHMTAKPQTSMTFDQSDEVHVAAPPAAVMDKKFAANEIQQAAKEKDQRLGVAQNQRTQTRQLLVSPSQNFDTYSAGNLSKGGAFQWSLSPAGQPQRSLDSGQTWHVVPVQNGPFLVLKSIGNDVWIGGRAGSLYHSSDAGENWTKIEPTDAGRKLEADVKEINFTDPLNGTVTTVSDQIWSTSDSGKNWQLK